MWTVTGPPSGDQNSARSKVIWAAACKILQCEKLLIFFSAKNINVFAVFQYRNFYVMLAKNFIKFPTKAQVSNSNFRITMSGVTVF